MGNHARLLDDLDRVFQNAPREVERVSRVLSNGASAARSVAHALEPAIRLYRETHGGQRSDGVQYTEVPDESGGPLVELGSLTAVSYLTNKDRRRGRSSRPDQWIHDFETPYPVLAFRAESRELVIVRMASRYTVQAEGIEG